MKKKYCLIFFLLIPNHALLQPVVCDIPKLEKMLDKMRFSQNLRVNKELLDEVGLYYDDNFKNYLVETHPHLRENPNGAINEETLTWLKNMINYSMSFPFRYKFFSFPTYDEPEYDKLINELVFEHEAPFFRTQAIFPRKEHLGVFIKAVNEEGVITRKFKRARPGLSNEEAEAMAKRFIKHYMNPENSRVGFDDLPDDPRIEIIGHGGGDPSIISAVDEYVSYKQIVRTLIELKLPINAEIEMSSCWSSCPIAVSGQEILTKNQVLDMYEKNTLTSYFFKPNIPSFLKYFAKELFSKDKKFKGKVLGYPGYYQLGVTKDVYKINKKGNAVLMGSAAAATSIQTKDGRVNILRKDVEITLNRWDVAALD